MAKQRLTSSLRRRMPAVFLSDECSLVAYETQVGNPSRISKKRKCTFPLGKIMLLVLQKIREERGTLLLIALIWPNQPWVPELVNLSITPLWPIPLRRDLLAQAKDTLEGCSVGLTHPNNKLSSERETNESSPPSSNASMGLIISALIQDVATACRNCRTGWWRPFAWLMPPEESTA